MFMKNMVLVLNLVLVGCVSSPEIMPTPAHPSEEVMSIPGHSLKNPMFQFSGTWEGTLDGYNGPFFIDGEGFPMTFRIEIDSNDNATVHQKIDESWKEMKPGQFFVLRWGSQAIVTSLTAGQDEEGTWVEGSTFTLVHTNSDTVVAYWLRTVNNLDLPPTAEYFHFAWGNSGKLHRVSKDG